MLPVWTWRDLFPDSVSVVEYLDAVDYPDPFLSHLIPSLAFSQHYDTWNSTAFVDANVWFLRVCSAPFFLNKWQKDLQGEVGKRPTKDKETIENVFDSTRFGLEDFIWKKCIPGVSFVCDASANADCVGSVTLTPVTWAFELCAVPLVLANGLQRRRFVGRWFSDSQSRLRFNVAHAIFYTYTTCTPGQAFRIHSQSKWSINKN